MAPSIVVHTLHKRSNTGATGGIVAGVVVVALICLILGGYIGLGRLRTNHSNPKYIPTKYLKKKYTDWRSDAVKKKRNSSLADRRSVQERQSPSPATTLQRLSRIGDMGRNHDGTPNQRASVRSIMTLPSYSADAREHEQIIGREGERGGIDTVVEFPEDEAESENRREEEMESLYQIRVRRREERAAREQRRRLRREARARNDREALETLREDSRRAREGNDVDSSRDEMTAAQLLEEHRNQQRGRRLASVEYAELGVARHDGSRLRTNSTESDRPLLSSAAPMSSRARGMSDPRVPPMPNNSSTASLPMQGHTYHQSGSSLSRFNTNAADISDMEDDMSDVEAGDRRPSTSAGRPGTSENARSIYSGSIGGGPASTVDLGNQSMDTLPREHPPGYEESLRAAQSSVDVSRPDLGPELTETQTNQSSYSRGRRFGLPKGWGGRKQVRDEESGREMHNQSQSSFENRPATASAQQGAESDDTIQTPLSDAPPYESPTAADAPQLPSLTQLPSIEITPFTPVQNTTTNEDRPWPL